MARFVALIAGNIGCGKTDLLNYIGANKEAFRGFLREGEELVTIPEFIDPVSLEIFYDAKNEADRSPYEAQIATEIFEESNLVGRVNRHFKAKRGSGIYFFDRGMIEGAETFCQNSFDEGDQTDDAKRRYSDRLKNALDQLGRREQQRWLEQLVIYLKVDGVEILQERQRKRSTKGEIIPAGYLERLRGLYEKFFQDIDSVYTRYGVRPPEVLTIDASMDFNDNLNYLPGVLEKIVHQMEQMEERGVG